MNNFLSANYYTAKAPTTSTSFLQTHQSSSLHEQFLKPPQLPTDKHDICDLEVSVKEPKLPIADSSRVAKIASLQRFDSPDWNSVRYSDIQKKYIASPAFSELKVNKSY